ncbi:MAG: hypothetical protein ACAI35_26370 [Candidatus Methylacidiphilales bacterium]
MDKNKDMGKGNVAGVRGVAEGMRVATQAAEMVRVEMTVPRELVCKMGRKKFFQNSLTSSFGVGNLLSSYDIDPDSHAATDTAMPNQHAPDKASIGLWMTGALKQRLEAEAKTRRMCLTQFIIFLYEKATRDVELTPEDYRQLAADTQRAGAGKRVRTKGDKTAAEAQSDE